jgi:hypothetical protein
MTFTSCYCIVATSKEIENSAAKYVIAMRIAIAIFFSLEQQTFIRYFL